MTLHVYSSIAGNYVPKARVLAQSVKRHLPGAVFHLVVVERAAPALDLAHEPFDHVLTLADLDLPQPVESWVFKHRLVEACTAVKGPALVRLLDEPGASAVLYFDPDIALFSGLDSLLARFADASILLTPHGIEPDTDPQAVIDNEISHLKHGVYNLGFLGVKPSGEGKRFAGWWAERLRHWCHDDIPGGLFTDQRWVDLAPAFFDEVAIIREPQYDVCTWNLTHRHCTGSAPDAVLVNGQPLGFYHFSAIDRDDNLTMLKIYGRDMPVLFDLREWYLQACREAEAGIDTGRPWDFATFEDGKTVTPEMRLLYRRRVDLQQAYPDPFALTPRHGGYRDWWQAHGEREFAALFGDPAMPENRARIEQAMAELAAIKASRSWQLVSRLQRLYRRFVPARSRS